MIAVQTVSGASASVRARHDAAGAVSSSAHHVAIEKSLRIIASLPRKTLQLSSITATRGCSRYDRDRRQGGRLRDADPDARRCDTGEAQNQWPGLARRHFSFARCRKVTVKRGPRGRMVFYSSSAARRPHSCTGGVSKEGHHEI